MDQRAALRLAICNDIGEASYDGERVAAALVELIRATHAEVSAQAEARVHVHAWRRRGLWGWARFAMDGCGSVGVGVLFLRGAGGGAGTCLRGGSGRAGER